MIGHSWLGELMHVDGKGNIRRLVDVPVPSSSRFGILKGESGERDTIDLVYDKCRVKGYDHLVASQCFDRVDAAHRMRVSVGEPQSVSFHSKATGCASVTCMTSSAPLWQGWSMI